MKFYEEQFRDLVCETGKTVVALGTTSKMVLKRHQKFAEQLVEYLRAMDIPFERDICLQWVDSMEHDPAAVLSSSYVEWIALRRFVILLAEQKDGTLTSWKHYQSRKVEMPESKDFSAVLPTYKAYLEQIGLQEKTVIHHTSSVRRLLIHLEKQGTSTLSDIQNVDIAGYFVSPRFDNRRPGGVQAEACELKKFVLFLNEYGYNGRDTLQYAIPKYRVPVEKIVTTLTHEMVSDVLEDEPDSLVDKRDKAVCLLALHVGLRSCDIRNLKFSDVDWDKGILTIKQQKTDVYLQMPLDNETQNAIIDYVLNERRKCETEYIFVTGVGPAQKIARRHYRIKYRAAHEQIPHEGLHIFRRTFASKLLKSGTPLERISEMLGHVDKASVQCYLSTDDEKMRRCALDLSLIPCKRRGFDV